MDEPLARKVGREGDVIENRETSPETILNPQEYKTTRIPRNRNLVTDILREGKKKHHVNTFHSIDVTPARQLIRQYQLKTGETLSFTAFLIKCVAQAINEHHQVQGLIQGIFRKKRIIFNTIDVALFIERDLGNGETIPVINIVRNAQTKSLLQISREIRVAQNPLKSPSENLDQNDPRKSEILASLPPLLRKFVWWVLMHTPRLFKQHFGTAVISSVGMYQSNFSQALGTTIWPFALIVGGIGKQPVVGSQEGREIIEIHEVLGITTCIDHVIIDGAPAARFVDRLIQLIHAGYGCISPEKNIEGLFLRGIY